MGLPLVMGARGGAGLRKWTFIIRTPRGVSRPGTGRGILRGRFRLLLPAGPRATRSPGRSSLPGSRRRLLHRVKSVVVRFAIHRLVPTSRQISLKRGLPSEPVTLVNADRGRSRDRPCAEPGRSLAAGLLAAALRASGSVTGNGAAGALQPGAFRLFVAALVWRRADVVTQGRWIPRISQVWYPASWLGTRDVRGHSQGAAWRTRTW